MKTDDNGFCNFICFCTARFFVDDSLHYRVTVEEHQSSCTQRATMQTVITMFKCQNMLNIHDSI